MEDTTKKESSAPKRKNGETLKEKVHRHLHDKNDKITNEDIRDAIVGEEAVTDIEKKSNEMTKEIPKDTQTTPWDILDEEQ